MTDMERRIIDRDEQQQSLLSSELASRSSFIGAIATLAAFLVVQWGQGCSLKVIPILLYAAVGIAFILLLLASAGQEYWMPALPADWSGWLRDRADQVRECQYPEAEIEAESDLRDAVFGCMEIRAAKNRAANKRKATLLNARGTIAVIAVLAILALSIASKVGLF